jgi:FecR protein
MSSFFKHLGMAALALLPVLSSAALQPGKVATGKVQGTVTITEGKSKQVALKSGHVFQEGSIVETAAGASTAELILSNGSTVLLSPGTRLEVRTFRQVASELVVPGSYQQLEKEPSASVTEIQIIHGKVTGEVRKLNAMSSYIVRTPAGMTRIRGTIYTVEYKLNANGLGLLVVSCVRGSVETTVNDSNYGPVAVEPGMELSSAVRILAVAPGVAPKPVAAAPVAAGAEPTLLIRNVILSPVKILLLPISSELLAEATRALEGSSLSPGIAKTVETMISTAPPEAAYVWNGVVLPAGVSVLDGSKTLVEAEGKNPPGAPTSTTTGGGGTQGVMDAVNRTVEGKQVIATPTGT